MEMILYRPLSPFSLKYFLASLMAASFASAPLLQKNTRSAKLFSASQYA